MTYKFCGGSSSSSSRSSSPKSSTGGLNPGNVADLKGLGIETIHQKNNSTIVNFASGNGRIGAIVSPTQENSFFGNRAIEIDEVYLQRRINDHQYRTNKLNLLLGAKVFNKKYMGLNLGGALKWNPSIKNLNPGLGASVRLALFHFGAFFYKDDIKINLGSHGNPYTSALYSNFYGTNIYEENFLVSILNGGVKIMNLSMDAALIKTNYKFYNNDTRIYLYSGAYSLGKFLFSAAKRNEYSPNLFYKNGVLNIQRQKVDYFYGVQYALGKHFLFGVNYNNFLLKELSALATAFF